MTSLTSLSFAATMRPLGVRKMRVALPSMCCSMSPAYSRSSIFLEMKLVLVTPS